MGKPAFCICENKDADQLPYTEVGLLPISKISSLQPYSEVVLPGFCRFCCDIVSNHCSDKPEQVAVFRASFIISNKSSRCC